MKARILIMDEPTSSLTLDDTERLFQVIRDLRAQGVAIVYISHRLTEIETLADRVVVLRDGRNVGVLARGEIVRDGVVRMMVDREVRRGGPRRTVRCREWAVTPACHREAADDAVSRAPVSLARSPWRGPRCRRPDWRPAAPSWPKPCAACAARVGGACCSTVSR